MFLALSLVPLNQKIPFRTMFSRQILTEQGQKPKRCEMIYNLIHEHVKTYLCHVISRPFRPRRPLRKRKAFRLIRALGKGDYLS